MPELTIDGQPVHVLDRGSGTPVVLLHAFPLQAAMWDYQAEELAADHRVVAIDLPGFGASPAPPDPRAVTIDTYADLVAGVIRQLDLGAVVLGGLSMGGYVAFAVVRRHAELLRALVLADTRAQSDDSAAWQRRTDQQQALEQGESLEGLAKQLVENLLGRDSLLHQELVDYVTALIVGNQPGGLVGALEAMKNRPDSLLTLAHIEVPTLVMVGNQDRLTPLTDATLLSGRIPNSRLVEIPGAGHLSNIENPIEFNRALREFLAELDG